MGRLHNRSVAGEADGEEGRVGGVAQVSGRAVADPAGTAATPAAGGLPAAGKHLRGNTAAREQLVQAVPLEIIEAEIIED